MAHGNRLMKAIMTASLSALRRCFGVGLSSALYAAIALTRVSCCERKRQGGRHSYTRLLRGR